ncbi:MAG: hypothetical protein ACI8QZ_002880 [Chlamydiales bacterium]|jgi:hypothetical protein
MNPGMLKSQRVTTGNQQLQDQRRIVRGRKFLPRTGAFLILLSGLLGSCISASAGRMRPSEVLVESQWEAGVEVRVTGSEQNHFGSMAYNVPVEAFDQALKTAIDTHRVFLRGPLDEPKYRLEVHIPPVRPATAAGLDIKYKVNTRWTLTNIGTNEVFLEDTITGTHTATVGDAIAGGNRMILASTGAGMDAIRRGLKELSELPLRNDGTTGKLDVEHFANRILKVGESHLSAQTSLQEAQLESTERAMKLAEKFRCDPDVEYVFSGTSASPSQLESRRSALLVVNDSLSDLVGRISGEHTRLEQTSFEGDPTQLLSLASTLSEHMKDS